MKTSNERPEKYLGDVKRYYAIAYGLYGAGKYGEAAEAFQMLTVLDTINVDHWMGLGASHQMQKHFQKAVEAYAAAALLDFSDTNPLPHLHSAECLWELGEFDRARIAIKSALCIAVKDQKHHALATRLQLLCKRWKE